MFILEQMAQRLAQERQEINMANVIGKMAAERREEIEKQVSKRKAQLAKIESSTVVQKKNLNECADEMVSCETATVSASVNKSVTTKTREFVLAKSQCCVFKDPKTGRQCNSKFAVQADHIKSRRNGGDHSVTNLQTLCARHNRFKYQQEKLMEIRFFA